MTLPGVFAVHNPYNRPQQSDYLPLLIRFSRLALPLTLGTRSLQGGPHTYLGEHQAEPGLQVVNKHPAREEEEEETNAQ